MGMIEPTPQQAANALLVLKTAFKKESGSWTRRITRLSDVMKIGSLCAKVLEQPEVEGGEEALRFGMEALHEAVYSTIEVREDIENRVVKAIQRHLKEVLWKTIETNRELKGTDSLLRQLMAKQVITLQLSENQAMKHLLNEKLPDSKYGMEASEQFAFLCARYAREALATPKDEKILRFGERVLSECASPTKRVQEALGLIQQAFAAQNRLLREHRIQQLKAIPGKIFSAIRWLFTKLIPRWLTPSYWRSRTLKKIKKGPPPLLEEPSRKVRLLEISPIVALYESMTESPARTQMVTIPFKNLDFKKAGLWVVLSLVERTIAESTDARLQLLTALIEPMKAKLATLQPGERAAIATYVMNNVKPSDNPVIQEVILVLLSS